jgi:hypothetical protein
VRARELQADFYFNEIVEIADDKSEDPRSRQDRKEWYESEVCF